MTFPPSLSRLTCTFAAVTLLAGRHGAHAQAIARKEARPAPGFSISFHKADAVDVLRAFGLQSGLNLAISSSVEGKIISISLRNVTPEKALALIAHAAGVTYRKADGAYLIGTEEELKKVRSSDTLATYAPQHLTAAALKALVEETLPYLQVQSAGSSGTLTLTGSPDDVRNAQRLLSQVDVATSPVSDVITPQHISATFLADVLRQTEPGVTVTIRENALVLTGPREAIQRAKNVVPVVDTVSSVAQRTEVYRIRYSSALQLVQMLTAAVPGLQVTPSAEGYAPFPARFQPLTGGSLGSGSFATSGGLVVGGGLSGADGVAGASLAGVGGAGGTAVSVTKSRQLILGGSDAQVTQALQLLKAVDVPATQVAIEARIVDISAVNELNAGVQWGGSVQTQTTGGTGTGTTTQTFTQGTLKNNVSELNVPDFIRFGRFQRSPLDFIAQLQFLETQNKAKTLANPSISVLDNEDANIFIGDVIRFQILAVSSAISGNAFTVQEVPVGIALLVRPRVNDNGDITIKVHPVVSTLTTRDAAGLPQTASREADTTLRVHDGETIAIGGLLREQDIRSVQEVPLLAKVPLFGELFRNRTNRKERSNVIIFLTIRLLPSGDAATTAAPDVTNPANAPNFLPTAPTAKGK